MRSQQMICNELAFPLVAGWTRRPGDLIEPDRNLFSTDHDIQAGEAAAF
jgi:hypothetical protein